MVSLAPILVRELVGDDPDPGGMNLARDCMAAVPEPTYRATMLALLFRSAGATENVAAAPVQDVEGGARRGCRCAGDLQAVEKRKG